MKRLDGRDAIMLLLCLVSGMLGYVDGKYSGLNEGPPIITAPLRESDIGPSIRFDAPARKKLEPETPWLDGRRPLYDHPRPPSLWERGPIEKEPGEEYEPLFLPRPKPEPPPSWLT